MEYIAHMNNQDIQTIKEHLIGTAELSGELRVNLESEIGDIVVGCYTTLANIPPIFKKR